MITVINIQKKPWNFAKIPLGYIVYNALEGDEYCNDELNYLEFAYDGGDCCQGIGNQYKAFHFCTECRCKKEYNGWRKKISIKLNEK